LLFAPISPQIVPFEPVKHTHASDAVLSHWWAFPSAQGSAPVGQLHRFPWGVDAQVLVQHLRSSLHFAPLVRQQAFRASPQIPSQHRLPLG
jgi:hypothetical protein